MLRDGPWKIIRIQNLKGGNSWYYSDLDLPSRQYCDSGDLLFAWSATFGPFWWHGERAIFHYHIWKVVCGERIHRGFCSSLLEHMTAEVKAASHGGLGMLHMTKSSMEKWRVPLPPLDEQEAIETKLESIRRVEVTEAQKLETLRTVKTGLLQDLLTGKVRVLTGGKNG